MNDVQVGNKRMSSLASKSNFIAGGKTSYPRSRKTSKSDQKTIGKKFDRKKMPIQSLDIKLPAASKLT